MSRLTRASMFALLVRGYHPLRPCFPDRFQLSHIHDWPGPRSLATTSGVSVDVLSSRYLDVSVPWVRLKPPMYSEILYFLLITEVRNHRCFRNAQLFGHVPTQRPAGLCTRPNMVSEFRYRKWVSPFGNPWIKASSQLPTAYRSVARPSSPLSAKASTEHP